jgi:hypothetical protein
VTDDGAASGLRSTAARAMILVVATTSLIVGGAYLVIDRLHSTAADAVEHPGPPATDEQTQSEVVDHARDIVAIAELRQPSAGYLLMSCKNRDEPPYQGAIYMDFQLPSDVNADQYFRGVAAALVARGWHEGRPANQHLFGRNLFKDGVNATVYPDADSPARGVVRIYGRCRDTTDHRGATASWIDVTDRLH